MLQGGLRDAAGQPRAAELGNPPLEFNLPNKRGTVTMARWEDPNSGAGEFFINLGDSPHLDRTGDSGWALGFTVFGEVVRGLEVAETIAGLPTSVQGGMSMLTDPVVMESGALQLTGPRKLGQMRGLQHAWMHLCTRTVRVQQHDTEGHLWLLAAAHA